MATMWRELGRGVYGSYVLALFLVLTPLALVGVTLVPNLRLRRAIARLTARGIFALSGMGPAVRREARLPGRPCVIVANHASYLDGILLCAVLPPRFVFVIKSEMQRVPLAHFLLRRIGAQFVERFNGRRSARDARAMLRRAHDGQSLAVFPEGTFRSEPGLRRFRPGAFAAAVKTGMPVVPAVIRGSRHVLPAGRLLPRPGRLRLQLLAAIDTEGHSAASLAGISRARILERMDEPDLHAAETVGEASRYGLPPP